MAWRVNNYQFSQHWTPVLGGDTFNSLIKVSTGKNMLNRLKLKKFQPFPHLSFLLVIFTLKMKDALCWCIHGQFPQWTFSKLFHLLFHLSCLKTTTTKTTVGKFLAKLRIKEGGTLKTSTLANFIQNVRFWNLIYGIYVHIYIFASNNGRNIK